MSQTITPASIRKVLTIRAAQTVAFRVFTESFGLWWPKTHYLGDSPLIDAVIEPGIGGRWYSRHENGTESLWGKVLVWEPPTRVVLAWQISHEWGYDPNLLTEVDVRFTPRGDNETIVEFEHRGLERFGDSHAAAKTIVSMTSGWGLILDAFRAASESDAAPRTGTG